VVDGKTTQLPYSYVILSSDLLLLRDKRMSRSSYLKSYYSDYPEKLMEQFIKDLDALHTSHTYQFENNRKVPLLTREEDER
jgi:hypothetical protein